MTAITGIKEVYKVVKGFKGIIAGGCVLDALMGKEPNDIDVFVSTSDACKSEVLYSVLSKGFMFSEVIRERPSITVEDEDESVRVIEVSKIVSVLKGTIGQYRVEIMMVNTDDIRQYVQEDFDINITACYYDGKVVITEPAEIGFKQRIIRPLKFEPTGYIRASLCAKKYGFKVGHEYKLSRDYCEYLYEQGVLQNYVTKKYAYVDREMKFTGKYDIGNVMMVDMYYLARLDNNPRVLINHMMKIANHKQVAAHPLLVDTFDIELINHSHEMFHSALRDVSSALRVDYESPLHKYTVIFQMRLLRLQRLDEDDFMDNKVQLDDGRKISVVKYINRIEKEFPQVMEVLGDDIRIPLGKVKHIVETRNTKKTGNVKFSGMKDDLLRVSTDKEWTSCMKWELGKVNDNNIGVLGNVSGATIVGYFDEGENRWGGRFLIRIGEDHSLFIEELYTGRVEYKGSVEIVADELRKRGYTVYTKENVLNSGFVSKDLVLWPYNNHENVADVDFDDNGVLRMKAETSLSTRFMVMNPDPFTGTYIETAEDRAFDLVLEEMMAARRQ